VLADTEPVHFACWREVLLPFGIDLTYEAYRRHGMGLPHLELMESLGRLGDPPLELEVLAPKLPGKLKRFVELALQGEPLSPATVELIKSLSHYKLAVVSSSKRSEVEPLLIAASVRDCFGALVCGSEAGKSKPAPDPYLLAAKLLGARMPLVVEDSDYGVASAVAAGFPVVRVTGPAATPAAVRAALLGC
jgi:beta-phosphoglucomutase